MPKHCFSRYAAILTSRSLPLWFEHRFLVFCGIPLRRQPSIFELEHDGLYPHPGTIRTTSTCWKLTSALPRSLFLAPNRMNRRHSQESHQPPPR